MTWSQPFDRQLHEPAEEAEILDADDDRMELLADLPLQVGQQLDADQLPLGRLGPAFGPRAVLAQDDQLVGVAPRLLPLQDRRHLAVRDQVGIAPDRRREVAVIVAGQRVMPFLLGGVDRLLEAPQEAVMDGVLLRLAGGLLEDPLELEPALRKVEREPQAAGELGELIELVRLGIGVDPAQEARVVLGEEARRPPRWPPA